MDMVKILLFMENQIKKTKVMLESVKVIITKNIRWMTRHLGRDFMVVQQVLFISRQWNGRCGDWSLNRLRRFKRRSNDI